MIKTSFSINHSLDAVLRSLDTISHLALSPEHVADVADCEVKLGQIKSRVELILSFIDADRLQPNRVGRSRWK
jgi:hypothetical protein